MANTKQTPTADAAHNTSDILTKGEPAGLLRCTPRYLERQIRAGRLKALKPTGKLLRIRRADLDAFLESGATVGGVQ
jgi:excisionase family DNA binding protein